MHVGVTPTLIFPCSPLAVQRVVSKVRSRRSNRAQAPPSRARPASVSSTPRALRRKQLHIKFPFDLLDLATERGLLDSQGVPQRA